MKPVMYGAQKPPILAKIEQLILLVRMNNYYFLQIVLQTPNTTPE
jgi:hypothetical protein